MFSGATNVAISGGNFIINETSGDLTDSTVLEKLAASTAHRALHDSAARHDAPKCHPETRTALLERLERWIQGQAELGTLLMWLYGGAGAGKSAIMQTVAESCIAQGLVLATFFFSRSDTSRNSIQAFFATLAYQIACSLPSAIEPLRKAISTDPLIFRRGAQRQADELLVRPLQHLVAIGKFTITSPRVFIIDGLDECNDFEEQILIISSITDLLRRHQLPILVLLASRPEQAISMTLRNLMRGYKICSEIALSDDANSEDDIRRFVVDSFHKICARHPFRRNITLPWPSKRAIEILVEKSSGHFIYASSAIKYISSPKDNPMRSLDVILSITPSRTEMPFAELDALYHHILGSAAHLDKVLHILAFCIICHHLPNSVAGISSALGYSVQDIRVFLVDLGALVSIEKDNGEPIVKIKHASLSDFLLDSARSGRLYISNEHWSATMVQKYLELFDISVSRSQDKKLPEEVTAAENRNARALILTICEAIGSQTAPLPEIMACIGQYPPRMIWNLLRISQDPHPRSVLPLSYYITTIQIKYKATGCDSKIYSRFMSEFLDIFEEQMQLEKSSLGGVISSLLFAGFPLRAVHTLSKNCESEGTRPYYLMREIDFRQGYPTPADLASMPQSQRASSSAALTETARKLLHRLFAPHLDPKPIPSQTPHDKWLQSRKRRGYFKSGLPELAKVWYQKPKLMFIPFFVPMPTENYIRQETYPVLLEALIFALSRATYSEDIVRYARRSFPLVAFQMAPILARRARRALDDYIARTINEKSQDLEKRILDGSRDALFEKIQLYKIDDVD